MAIGTVTVRDILTYHNMERIVFDRLLRLLRNREASKKITVLWVWLERIGFRDIVSVVRDSPDERVVRFTREAEAILDVLHQDAPPPADDPRALPLSAGCLRQPISLRFFYANRDMVIRGMAEIMGGVGMLIFNDGLRGLMNANPNAPELSQRFWRQQAATPEHTRTMLIMFAWGHPVEREHNSEYFTTRWGDCSERVVVEVTAAGTTPMYGRVVFRTESYLELALNRQQQTEFVVNGRQLWGLRTMING